MLCKSIEILNISSLMTSQQRALPHLQSVVIVLIKAILSHVTALVTQANGSNGLQSGFQFQENQNGTTSGRPDTNGVSGHHGTVATNEELDTMRTQEVLDKAVSGMLILLLKWFKVSRKSSGLPFFQLVLMQLARHIEI